MVSSRKGVLGICGRREMVIVRPRICSTVNVALRRACGALRRDGARRGEEDAGDGGW